VSSEVQIGALFGVAAIILLPVGYGVLGFVTSLIGAAIYNAVPCFRRDGCC